VLTSLRTSIKSMIKRERGGEILWPQLAPALERMDGNELLTLMKILEIQREAGAAGVEARQRMFGNPPRR